MLDRRHGVRLGRRRSLAGPTAFRDPSQRAGSTRRVAAGRSSARPDLMSERSLRHSAEGPFSAGRPRSWLTAGLHYLPLVPLWRRLLGGYHPGGVGGKFKAPAFFGDMQ